MNLLMKTMRLIGLFCICCMFLCGLRAVGADVEKSLIKNLQFAAAVNDQAQFWADWDASAMGTKNLLGTLSATPFDVRAVGNNVSVYANIDNNFATASANLKIKEDAYASQQQRPRGSRPRR
jgi:hypothetical protein